LPKYFTRNSTTFIYYFTLFSFKAVLTLLGLPLSFNPHLGQNLDTVRNASPHEEQHL